MAIFTADHWSLVQERAEGGYSVLKYFERTRRPLLQRSSTIAHARKIDPQTSRSSIPRLISNDAQNPKSTYPFLSENMLVSPTRRLNPEASAATVKITSPDRVTPGLTFSKNMSLLEGM
jgi:hypothetical protein